MISIRRPWIERYMEARRHVIDGRKILNRQRELIARNRDQGQNTDQAKSLLVDFERSQAIFEQDLDRISGESR
jgi:hypothetical protein